MPGTLYYIRAYATNNIGTGYGNEESFITQTISVQPCPGFVTVTDNDGNIYNTVQIGNQCWMKDNLRTTRYADGTTIPLGPLGSSTSITTPYRYNPNNDSSNVSAYGYLYNWPAVMHGASSSASNPSGVQGICPSGWHVPSDAEWTQLTNYVGSQPQFQCYNSSDKIAKALASTTGWNSSTNTCAVGNYPSTNNATDFSAFPAGIYNNSGNYVLFGGDVSFWSATAFSDHYAYYRYLDYNDANVYRYNNYMNYGFSVRCVRDSTGSVSLPTVTTNTVSNISATCEYAC